MSQPNITVIIPTRERCETLEKSLRTVTNQSYANLQIIVSDNFSGDRTEELVRSVSDERLKYVNTGRRLSMAANWEFALSQVDSGWVTIIGDDDGLLPESVSKVAGIIRSSKVKAVRSSVCAYVWPSLLEGKFGRLAVPLGSGSELRKSRSWLHRVLAGHNEYRQLPMLYNGGYVDVSVLREIKERTGSVYKSCVPDVYSAISIASTVEEYVYCHEPLAINGASKHSTGTSYFSVDKKDLASPVQLFAAEGNMPFHEDVPLCRDGSYPPSIQALVYESYLQSRALRGKSDDDLAARMLRIILTTAGRHQSQVDDWGAVFAEKHRLDFDSISARAKSARVGHAIKGAAVQLANSVNTFSIGSRGYPIVDIYEASVVAGAIRAIGVGRARNMIRLLKRWLEPSR